MKVIFVCGLGGDAGMTYVKSLKILCEKKGFEFFAPSMPSFEERITYEKYVERFEKLVKKERIDLADVLLIGQSAGTNFAVKYFANHPTELKGYISVSGFSKGADRNLPEGALKKLSVIEGFRPTEKEYEVFKNFKFPKFSVFGGKDCFFTKENLEDYASLIGVKKFYDKDGVHCTISENITTHGLLHKVIEENY